MLKVGEQDLGEGQRKGELALNCGPGWRQKQSKSGRTYLGIGICTRLETDWLKGHLLAGLR